MRNHVAGNVAIRKTTKAAVRTLTGLWCALGRFPAGTWPRGRGVGGRRRADAAHRRLEVVRVLPVLTQVETDVLVLLAYPQAHGVLDGQGDEGRDDEGVDRHAHHCQGLVAQQADLASVKESVLAADHGSAEE